MPFLMKVAESEVLGKGKYKNSKGNTECVVFVQAVTDVPGTSLWKKGLYVKDAKDSDIQRGTAIATFDDAGNYPSDGKGQHAAIYLSHR